jgi:hypothetical protein
MKIAFLTREYPPDSLWGGPATVYHALTSELVLRGHEVHVIYQAINGPEDCIDKGVHVHKAGTNPKQYSIMARINYSFYSWLKLKKLIKTGRFCKTNGEGTRHEITYRSRRTAQ